jgi:ATP-dependent RNA helicase RhlB
VGFLRDFLNLFSRKGERTKSNVIIKEVVVESFVLPEKKEEFPKTELPKKKKKTKNKNVEKKSVVQENTNFDTDIFRGQLIENIKPEPYEEILPPPKEGYFRFKELGIAPALLRAVNDIGFQYATEIQQRILPHSLKGLDVTGKAQTGTGKTAAFLLTIFQRLSSEKPLKPRTLSSPRALVMAPTRELVLQIKKDADELGKYLNPRVIAIFGGIDYEKQQKTLAGYLDLIIATPGRILDYFKQGLVKFNRVEILVLDEADRMLDMGFLPDMRRIINATTDKNDGRQTMLFSATLSQEIVRLARAWTKDPITVEVEPEQVTSAAIKQLTYIISEEEKLKLLINMLTEMKVSRAIIFANRRDQVHKLYEQLTACDFSCGMLTGDVNQAKRIKTLENFRAGKINILVATDVAGRGIHVEGIETVFNYTLPSDPDDYVHRIGRTGRAGAKGMSVCFATEEDAYMLPSIEEYIKEPLNYITPDESLIADIPEIFQKRLKNLKRIRKPSPMKRVRKKS